MNIVNRRSGLSRKQPQTSTEVEITLEQLFGLSLERMVTWVKRQKLQAQLRSLHGMADYFAWQQANGTAGLADAQKRIAVAKSDLRQLQEH